MNTGQSPKGDEGAPAQRGQVQHSDTQLTLTTLLLYPSQFLTVLLRKLKEVFLLFSTILNAWKLLWAISIFNQAYSV